MQAHSQAVLSGADEDGQAEVQENPMLSRGWAEARRAAVHLDAVSRGGSGPPRLVQKTLGGAVSKGC